MDLAQIITILKDFKAQLAEEYGISEIGVFGSVIRNNSSENSDIDVVIRIQKPDLFLLVGIKDDLEERLNSAVDIVSYRDNMNRYLKQRIDNEAVYV